MDGQPRLLLRRARHCATPIGCCNRLGRRIWPLSRACAQTWATCTGCRSIHSTGSGPCCDLGLGVGPSTGTQPGRRFSPHDIMRARLSRLTQAGQRLRRRNRTAVPAVRPSRTTQKPPCVRRGPTARQSHCRESRRMSGLRQLPATLPCRMLPLGRLGQVSALAARHPGRSPMVHYGPELAPAPTARPNAGAAPPSQGASDDVHVLLESRRLLVHHAEHRQPPRCRDSCCKSNRDPSASIASRRLAQPAGLVAWRLVRSA